MFGNESVYSRARQSCAPPNLGKTKCTGHLVVSVVQGDSTMGHSSPLRLGTKWGEKSGLLDLRGRLPEKALGLICLRA